MTWWRKRPVPNEREEMQRIIAGINVKTDLEIAIRDMRRAIEAMELSVAALPEEDE